MGNILHRLLHRLRVLRRLVELNAPECIIQYEFELLKRVIGSYRQRGDG